VDKSCGDSSRAPIIHKSHQSNTLHPLIQIINHLVERLVDIGASMFILSIILVKELGIQNNVYGCYSSL